MQAIKPTKLAFKKVEAEWYDYHHTLKEIAKLREEIMNPFDEDPDDPTIVKGANSVRMPGDPTRRMATRLTTSKQLTYLNEIVDAIENVYNALPDDYKKLVRVRYWGNKNLNWNAIANELHVNRTTALRWRDEIIQATIELLGWR
ncbi:hypothetical protein GCM10011409_37830 [Lentibacillus populi]|uniref:Uncharacterized protein n=1 Tax=Lentibacillus populi TaxID=1827502 RepID=A0A9W5U167_9BACI|nr:transcriptional regulator [Lentibacillus populi]GGB56708.1 hypothetical protein GCM10011409_37830 [Lentibacillus populi]